MTATMCQEKVIAATNGSTTLPDYLRQLLLEITEREQFTEFSMTTVPSTLLDGTRSEMFRCKISGPRSVKDNENGETGTALDGLSLVCKIPPQFIRRKRAMSPLFQREIYTYQKILPSFLAFQQLKDISTADMFTGYPKCFGTFSDYEHNDYAIVLEDLNRNGYSVWNKFDRLNYSHAKLALTALGQFHGISFAFRDQKPAQFKELMDIESNHIKGLFAIPNAREFLERTYKKAISTLAPHESNLIKKMQYLHDTLELQLRAATDLKSAETLSVLNHGDFWNNNLMFKATRTETDRVAFIDWQTCQFCSPATDVAYYLYSSTEQQLRDDHFDDLLYVYYVSLAETIERLGSNATHLITFEQFMEQFHKFAIYGLLMAPLTVQAITLSIDDIPQGEPQNYEDRVKRFMGTSVTDRYKVRMSDVIRDFFNRGYSETLLKGCNFEFRKYFTK